MSTPIEQPAWRVLLGYVRPFRRALVAGGALSLATAATGLALPLVVRELIGRLGGDGGGGGSVVGLLGLMTVLVLTNAAIGAVGSFLLERTAESVVLVARRRLVDRLLWLRVPALDTTEPGDLMSRVSADTTLLREVSTQSVVSAVTGALTLLATVTMMILLDPLLLAVTLTALVLAQVVVGVVVPRISRAAKQAQESVGTMSAALERALGNLRTVKASGAEARERDRLHDAAFQAWRGGVRAAVWQAVAGNTGGLAIQLSFIVVLGLGGARVVSGAIDVGTLVAFLLYLYYLMPPMRDLAHVAAQYQVGAAAIARIREVETLPTEPASPPGPHATVNGQAADPASVAFTDVRFRYRPELPEVHHGVTFTVPPGGMTAFVGPSGAGKTTVFSLIERFYDADSGHVRLDGVDVGDWPLAELRAAIGYVEQDAPVLSGTLRDNLLFAAPHTTDTELRDALATTRLDGMIARLPDGLDTPVGHRGIKLSGGERQRVAIARALLRRPRLLLLDEVTSQLDAVNEAALRETIADAATTTTVLVVAHRLSTVTAADRIVVMDTGRVRATGTHTELVATDPLYAELAATQLLTT
ncbi:MAG: ATP-binding cassette domain-containing protein [Actinophytocola sp.]|uniref:ABC transporter ATP-binding protein n=1 Tax=Actinophytocola sp. TaxID=1872138 RepID=UPI00132A2610|nr:ABC transporter ATP-binding protein [Actinophytocola sp.]MPZ81936.1 ATP-binding cassette domain-containing protein [Actinophytocola sp.]